jgi:hypothetical protein
MNTEGWFECDGYPQPGVYLFRASEDDEPDFIVVRCGSVFRENGERVLIAGGQWKRIGDSDAAHRIKF